MSENLYALGDIGATNLRVGLYGARGDVLLYRTHVTKDLDYEGTLDLIAETVGFESPVGEVVAGSFAVAAEFDNEGVITRAGGLRAWVGLNPAEDIARVLTLSEGMVGTPNDAEAIAISQQAINRRNNWRVPGIATTISSGWGGALFWADGRTKADEPGHEFLRAGGICPCGEEGHAEAFMSGGGININHGMTAAEWLRTPTATELLVKDMSAAMIAMIERHKTVSNFVPEEIRWTGGLALNQPFIMERVAQNIRNKMPGIVVDTVTMGEQAGLHGTFVDATKRAVSH